MSGSSNSRPRHKMTDDELLAHIEQLDKQAVGFFSSEIAHEQTKAQDYYLAKPFGTEEEGRSRVVSTDVWDVVEGLTPLVLRPFVSSDDVVKFNAQGPEDEEAAQQETDYVNFVVTQKNDVFNELISWVKTGLLQKNGVVKYWWDTSTSKTIERYFDIPDDVYASLAQDDSVDIVEHTETDDGAGNLTHDCVLRISQEHGEAKFAVIPPEEFRISRDALTANPKLARFVAHVTKKTLSAIREMGFDVDDELIDYAGDDPNMSPQYLARRLAEETRYGSQLGADADPSMREVLFYDAYLRIDVDGDGIAELRRVIKCGRTVLLNEEVEEIPFVAWTPYPQPHKFYGRCPADETTEIQLIKSTLWRQSLDNIYTINNNRVYAGEGVNLDDLLDNQIAGVVRVKGGIDVRSQVMSAEVTPIGGIVQPMIEYLDSAKENRTGFSRYNQGSADLSNQKTLGEVQIVSEQSGQRVDLISRAFAEQGMKPLMIGIHGLIRRHGSQKETIRLRGKWVEVDPRQWKTRYDMTVSVGLGTANLGQKMQGQQMIMARQDVLMPLGLVKPDNLYNSAAKFAELLGEKSPEKYFQDPSKAEPAPPPDPMDDPKIMLAVADSKRKDAELKLKERDQDLKERQQQIDSLLAHIKIMNETIAMGSSADPGVATLSGQAAQIEAAAQPEVMDDINEPEDEPGEAPEGMSPQPQPQQPQETNGQAPAPGFAG